MEDRWLAEAVSNNAAWCDAIASSHDIATDWNALIWVSENPMPPLYPNIITLRSGSSIDELIDSISPRLPRGWAIKDSFSDLDLEKKGFALAFDAHWYCRVPTHHITDNRKPQYRVKTVNSQSELDRWVIAWGQGSGIFNYTLLENNSVELIYVERNNMIVSGLASNLSGNSVGISNLFGSPTELLGCVSSVVARHSTKGIVGYGSKAEIAALSSIGFKEIGDLRIWLRK